MTRPGIVFSMSVASQFMAAPRTAYWDALMRIMRYVKGAPYQGLIYKNRIYLRIQGYTDADLAGCPYDRRYATRYAIFIDKNLISWKSEK